MIRFMYDKVKVGYGVLKSLLLKKKNKQKTLK